MLIVAGFWALVVAGMAIGIGVTRFRKWWVRTLLGVTLIILSAANLQ